MKDERKQGHAFVFLHPSSFILPPSDKEEDES
jgi:hypothetical protein